MVVTGVPLMVGGILTGGVGVFVTVIVKGLVQM